MGSFTSTYTYDNGDHEDNDINLPESMSQEKLFESLQINANMKLPRCFLHLNSTQVSSKKRNKVILTFIN